jgi:hypothetical protein
LPGRKEAGRVPCADVAARGGKIPARGLAAPSHAPFTLMTGYARSNHQKGSLHAGRLEVARELAGNRVDSASPTREQSMAHPEPIIRFGTPSHGRAAGRVDDQIGGLARVAVALICREESAGRTGRDVLRVRTRWSPLACHASIVGVPSTPIRERQCAVADRHDGGLARCGTSSYANDRMTTRSGSARYSARADGLEAPDSAAAS